MRNAVLAVPQTVHTHTVHRMCSFSFTLGSPGQEMVAYTVQKRRVGADEVDWCRLVYTKQTHHNGYVYVNVTRAYCVQRPLLWTRSNHALYAMHVDTVPRTAHVLWEHPVPSIHRAVSLKGGTAKTAFRMT